MSPRLQVALISSGLGRELRGIETWMADLAAHLPDSVSVKLWGGGAFVSPRADRPEQRIGGISRNHRLLRSKSWSDRYYAEQHTALPGALLRLMLQRPDVAYCGDPALSWNLKRFRRWHRSSVVFLNGMRLTPVWCESFDGVHVLAPPYIEEAARLLPGRSIDQFFSVPHFTDVERFHPPSAEERRAARRQFGIAEDAFVVLSIGPLGTASGKRVDHVAEELAQGSSRALLVSAGADEQGSEGVRSRITQALGPRAILLGRVERSRMAELHRAADVFALGTLGEPFSIAIAEALATGVPVVHHQDPITNWVAGVGGVAVSMSTRGAAADGFRRLEADAAWRSSLGVAGRSLATERYAPGPVCAALEREWRRIAQRSSMR